MAITRGDVELWGLLKGMLPTRPRVLELGEANWYCDLPPPDYCEEVPAGYCATCSDRHDKGCGRVFTDGSRCVGGRVMAKMGLSRAGPFKVAEQFYRHTLTPSELVAIDLNGTDRAMKLDLNEPLPDCPPFHEPFGIVINTGTLEHVFDQRQVWQTVHDACALGGLMVHSLPVAGWPDHGLYCYQPCFVEDMERANGYRPLAVYCDRDVGTAGNVQLHVAWQKVRRGPFVVPRQGRYVPKRDWRNE